MSNYLKNLKIGMNNAKRLSNKILLDGKLSSPKTSKRIKVVNPSTGEEIGEGPLYWIERGTLLVDLALTLLCVPTEGASECPTHSIPELFLFTVKQR